MTKKIDMQKLVDRLGDDCFEAHRGGFWWDEKNRLAVVFGNDGYQNDERARGEVEAIRRLLAEFGGKEVGFATESEEGYSWALACELSDDLTPDVLEGIAWAAWNQLCRQKAAGEKVQLDDNVGRERLTLDWEKIRKMLRSRTARSDADLMTGVQGNIAGAVLERNGLL
jgi:hypothetical protein